MNTAVGQFGDYPILSAASVLQGFRAKGLSTSGFLGKANQFVCPQGERPGWGYFLMQRKHILKLKPQGVYKLSFGTSTAHVELPSISYVSSQRLHGGVEEDDSTICIVQVADCRGMMGATRTNERINIREPAAWDTFVDGSATAADDPYTWAEAWTRLWDWIQDLAGVSEPSLPYTPHGYPDGFWYVGRNGWWAVNDYCRRLLIGLDYDPIADTFSLSELGAEDTTHDDLVTQHAKRKIATTEQIERDAAWGVPEKVAVLFRRHIGSTADALESPTEEVEVEATTVDAEIVTDEGTVLMLQDDLHAEPDGETAPSGGSPEDRDDRAEERAEKFYQMIRGLQPLTQRWVGALPFKTGKTVQEVRWADFGDSNGPQTIVIRRPVEPWRYHQLPVAGGGGECPPTWDFTAHGRITGGTWAFELTLDGTTETITLDFDCSAANVVSGIMGHSKYGEPDTPTIISSAFGPILQRAIHIRWSEPFDPPIPNGSLLDGDDGATVRVDSFGEAGSGGGSFDVGEIEAIVTAMDLDAATLEGMAAADFVAAADIGTTVQAYDADLAALATAFSAASASAAASLALHEDTDNGTHKATIIAPASLAADITITLPSATGTLVTTAVTALTSLVSVGTITTGVWNGTDIAVADGGTGASTAYGAADNLSIHGADVASAATLNLDTATGGLVDVTGTTTITAITLADGRERTVRFTGALTLTHGASLVLPGSANITTVAGDFAIFRGYAAGVVRCVMYSPITVTGSGAAVRATSPTFTTPNCGTPSAINLTNGTALPVAGITASTSTALGVGSIELGHASDNTLSRDSAGRTLNETFPLETCYGSSFVTTSEGGITSATGVDPTTPQHITFTLPAARTVKITACAKCTCTTATSISGIQIDVDGADTAMTTTMNDAATAPTTYTAVITAALSSGAHTIKLQFSTNAGTLTVSNRSIIVEGL